MNRDLEVFELGNHGIDLATWTGWDGPNERVPQGYPQPGDLPPQPATADAQWPQLPPARTRLEPIAVGGQLEAEIARSARVSLIECGVALVIGLAIGFGLCLLTPWSPL